MNPFRLDELPLTGTSLIEASAGTGKTFTIGRIVLRLVLEGQLDRAAQLAVVTFTEAAAAEISDRIRQVLQVARDLPHPVPAAPDEPDLATLVAAAREQFGYETVLRRLILTLNEFDLASITTIHGFCNRLLSRFAFETGIPLGRELQTENRPLQLAILADFWRKRIAPLPAGIQHSLGRFDPEKLLEEFSEALKFPLVAVKGPAAPSSFDPGWRDRCLIDLRRTLKEEWKDVEAVVDRLIADKKLIHQAFRSDYVANWKAAVRDFLESSDDPGEGVGKFTVQNLQAKRKDKDTELDLPAFRWDALWEEWTSNPKQWRSALLKEAYAFLTAEMSKRQAELGLCTASDLITDLVKALQTDRSGRVARLISQNFRAVLIDEFQDTDPDQYFIFERLFDGRPHILLAFIGDPKQAIYGFRGGDILTYQRAKTHIPPERQFTLAVNFRSEASLVEALNLLFQRADQHTDPDGFFLTPDIRAQAVSAGKAHLLPISQNAGPLAPFRLWTPPAQGSDSLARRASAVLQTLVSLLDPQNPAHIGPADNRRPLTRRDIAILVNSNDRASYFKAVLARAGIRAVTGREAPLFQSEQAEQLELLLKTSLRPGREGWQRALLLSGLFGFDADQLTAWEADSQARHRLLTSLETLADTWRKDGVAAAVNHWLIGQGLLQPQTGNEARRAAFDRQVTNFRHLLEVLDQEELRLGRVPERLLARWTQLKASADLHEQRLESDQAEDAVTILTMHKSKGLQWPVVFLPDLSSNPNSSSTWIDRRAEQTVVDFDPDSTHRQAVRRLENEQERRRLAYVALTRAEYLLIAYVSHPAKKSDSAMRKAGDALFRLAELNLLPAPGFEIAPLPPAAAVPPLPTPPAPPPRQTPRAWAAAQKDPKRQWWTSSFSALTRFTHHAESTKVSDTQPAAGIFAFPRGPEAGNLLHLILERIDFMDVYQGKNLDKTEAVVRGLLAGGAPPLTNWLPTILEWLPRVMGCPLLSSPAPFRLGQLSGEDRLSELEFFLGAGKTTTGQTKPPVNSQQLAEIIGPQANLVDPKAAVGSYLNGFIDLVFRQGGRWYILDWKSNHLGNSAERYDLPAMEQAMTEHNYHLQYHLYTAALDRYLSQAQDGYTYGSHFGGVFYLFLRGLDEQGRGVYFSRPSEDTIRRLQEVL